MLLLDICDNSSILNVLYTVRIIITLICIVVPIMLMISLMVKIVREIATGDANMLAGIMKDATRKMLAVVLLFLVPTFVNVLANISPDNNGYLSCFESANPDYIAQRESEEKALLELNNAKYKEYNEKVAEEAERREEQRRIDAANASGSDYNGGDSGYVGTGSYRTWKQYDSRWAKNRLGATGTIGSIGCTSTAISMALAKSGVRTKLGTTLSPASFVNWMNNNGGYVGRGGGSGNLLSWTTVQSLAPSFKYQGQPSLRGTNAQKTSQIAAALNRGEYVIASVNNSKHWVFVDYIKDGKVYILDPGSSSKTELFQYGGVNAYSSYKVN